MARVTIEDCLSRIDNHFDLVLVGSRRARQILAGAELTIDERGHKATVTALREIADGNIDRSILDEPVEENREDAEKELAALLAETDVAEEAKLGGGKADEDESLAAALNALVAPGDQTETAASEAQDIISLEGLQAEEAGLPDQEAAEDTQTEIQGMTAEDMAKMSDLNLDSVSDTEQPDEENQP